MSIVASILSMVLFLAFVTAGIQKLQFNPVVSEVAGRLGFSKKAYRRIGVLEILAGIAVLVGLSSDRGSVLGIINEVASGGLALMMVIAVAVHLRKGDPFKSYAMALVLFVLCLAQLLLRVL